MTYTTPCPGVPPNINCFRPYCLLNLNDIHNKPELDGIGFQIVLDHIVYLIWMTYTTYMRDALLDIALF